MRKALNSSDLRYRQIARALLAISLVASMAAFGCTTNRTHGEGEPYVGGPRVGSSSSSSTYGTSVPTTPPPMTSSYRGKDQARVNSRVHRLSADDAALIMADHLPRVRVLGPVNPGNPRSYGSAGVVTGRFVNPALATNPQATINSSISSQPVAAISSGAGGDTSSSAAIISGNLTAVNPTTSSAAVLPPTMTSSSTIAPSTVAATTAPVTAASTATTTTPTMASVNTGVGAAGAPVTVRTLNAAATTGSGDVRVRTASGRVVVTNVSQHR